MRVSIVPLLLVGLFPGLVLSQTFQIEGSSLDATGRFVVEALTDSDQVLTLWRFDDDTPESTTPTPVGMALAQLGVPEVFGEFVTSGLPKGLFRVVGSNLATHEGDIDGDGIKDQTELQATDFLNPIDGTDASVVDVFDVVPDVALGLDLPGTGAGQIESIHHADIYRFVATAGTGIFVDVVSHAFELILHDYRIIDPYGNVVKSARIGLADMGPVNLPFTGEYVLLVGDTTRIGTGEYAISITVIPAPQSFNIAIGDTIATNDPASGAGNIEAPGAFDSYFFTADAGDKVFLNTLSFSGTNTINYRLLDPTGVEVDTQQFNLGDMGTIELPMAGIYTIEVGEIGNDDTGTYSIALTEVPAPDLFAINIGDIISNAEPDSGAGNIETPGAFDHYTFSGTVGQKIFIDRLTYSGVDTVNYTLFDPSGNQLATKPFNLGDIASIELPVSGSYTLKVGEAPNDRTGTYSIQITNIPAPDVFSINIGDTVSNGMPGAGAGNIEVPGAFDEYTFSGTAGEWVYLTTGAFNGVNTINYRLLDPDDNQLDSQSINLGDMGAVQLPATGTYTIAVGEAPNEQTGTYSITLSPHTP